MPELAAQPLLSAEFLAVDTETNGLGRDLCELTEVGAVLVGGGELHERWGSLVGVSRPLSRGIQRFTGISQAMVDAAPRPERVLPELAAQLRGRVLVAHSARFDARVLRQAFDRAALTWPDPPVLCTVALARRLPPLQRRPGGAPPRPPPRRPGRAPGGPPPRAPRPGAGGGGAPPARCPTRSPARGSSARCSRSCARTRP